MKKETGWRILFVVQHAAVSYEKRRFLCRLFAVFTWLDFDACFLPFSPTPFLPLLVQRRIASLQYKMITYP